MCAPLGVPTAELQNQGSQHPVMHPNMHSEKATASLARKSVVGRSIAPHIPDSSALTSSPSPALAPPLRETQQWTHSPHFTDEETEAQTERTQTQSQSEEKLELSLPISDSYLENLSLVTSSWEGEDDQKKAAKRREETREGRTGEAEERCGRA